LILCEDANNKDYNILQMLKTLKQMIMLRYIHNYLMAKFWKKWNSCFIRSSFIWRGGPLEKYLAWFQQLHILDVFTTTRNCVI